MSGRTPRNIVATALTKWVEKGGDPILGPATQIKAVHVIEGAPPTKVDSWPTPQGCDLTRLTSEILDACQDFASGRKAKSTGETFRIIPYYGSGEPMEGGAREFFLPSIDRSSSEDDGALDSYTEGPTKAGQVHMGMRHLEKRHQQLDERDSILWSNAMEELKRLRSRCESLEKQNEELLFKVQDAEDKSLERKLKIYITNQEEDRKNRLTDALIPVGMQMANAAMGAPMFPTNTENTTLMQIESAFSSLTADEISGMMQALAPEKQLFFDAMLKAIVEKKRAALAKKKAEAESKVNGAPTDQKTVENLAKRQTPVEGQ